MAGRRPGRGPRRRVRRVRGGLRASGVGRRLRRGVRRRVRPARRRLVGRRADAAPVARRNDLRRRRRGRRRVRHDRPVGRCGGAVPSGSRCRPVSPSPEPTTATAGSGGDRRRRRWLGVDGRVGAEVRRTGGGNDATRDRVRRGTGRLARSPCNGSLASPAGRTISAIGEEAVASAGVWSEGSAPVSSNPRTTVTRSRLTVPSASTRRRRCALVTRNRDPRSCRTGSRPCGCRSYHRASGFRNPADGPVWSRCSSDRCGVVRCSRMSSGGTRLGPRRRRSGHLNGLHGHVTRRPAAGQALEQTHRRRRANRRSRSAASSAKPAAIARPCRDTVGSRERQVRPERRGVQGPARRPRALGRQRRPAGDSSGARR